MKTGSVKLTLLLVTFACVVLGGVRLTMAAPNYEINYQGKLADGAGVTVADGTYNIAFNLFTAASGGVSVWSSTTTVDVQNGLFSYMLGSDDTLAGVDFDQTLYLAVNIGGIGAPVWDGEMSPRKVLGAVPAAFVAATAEDANTVGGVASTSFLRNDQAGTTSASSAGTLLVVEQTGSGRAFDVYVGGSDPIFTIDNDGDVGIGTTSPERNLVVDGDVQITGGLYDNNNTSGQAGMILQSTNGGFEWVSTTSLNANPFGNFIDPTELAVDDFGSFSCNGSICTVDAQAISASMLANADFGAFTVLGGVASLDSGVVSSSTLSALNWSAGRILQASTTASGGFAWVATSTLGLGNGTFTGLTDTPNSYTASRVPFTNTGATALTDSANFIYTGSQLQVNGTNNAASTTVLQISNSGTGTGTAVNQVFAIGATQQPYAMLQANADVSAGASLRFFTKTSSAALSEKMRLTDDGLLGIGTTTPEHMLSVQGDARIYGKLIGGLNVQRTSAAATVDVLTVTNNGAGTNTGANLNFNLGASENTYGQIQSVADMAGGGGSLRFSTRLTGGALTEYLRLTDAGFFGVATTAPSYRFSVAGDIYATGALRGSNGSAGTSGMVLQSTGTSFQWVATSTLGIGGTGTVNTGASGYFAYYPGAGTTVDDQTVLSLSGADINLAVSSGIAWGGTRYLYASTTNDSIAFGENAGATFNSDTARNIALGLEAGQYASTSNSDSNNFIGHRAGRNNTGGLNNLLGYQTGHNNTGSYNNILGYFAGNDNTGSYNNILGYSAGNNNEGWENTIFGYEAGYDNTGDSNNLFGKWAGYENTGNYNELIGAQAGEYINATATVAIGSYALRGTSSFNVVNNVALGYRAGYVSATGASNNILIGYQAADSLTTGANNIIIGYDVEAPSNTGSNQLNIGNLIFGTGLDGTGTTLASGNVGIGTTSPQSKLDVWGTFRVGTSSTPLLFADTANGVVAVGTSSTGILDQYSLSTHPNHIYQWGGNATLRVANDISDNNGTNNIAIANTLSGGTSESEQLLGLLNRFTWNGEFAKVVGVTNDIVQASSTGEAYLYGVENNLYSSSTDVDMALYGVYNGIEISNGFAYGVYNEMFAHNEGLSSNLYGTYNVLRTYAGDNAYGTRIVDSSAGTGGTQYGLYVDLDDADVTNYSIYVNAGSGISYFGSSVGIGSTTPSYSLSVAGDIYSTGALRGSNGSAGTSGMVLQSTGTSFQWVATSTLGLGGSGASTFLGLTDTPSSFTANRIPYTNSGATALTDSANFTFDGTNLGLGVSNGIAWGGTRYLYASTTNDSIAFGELAGATFNSGTTYNVALGYAAGRYASTTDVDYNNFIGYQAGLSNTGNYNQIIGADAGLSNTGSENTIIGWTAGQQNSGWDNEIIGAFAGRYNSGHSNQFIGFDAGQYNTGNNNQMIGYDAGRYVQSTSSVLIGGGSFYGNNGGSGQGPFQATNNVAIGYRTGYNATTTANNNILIGYQAADNLTTGNNNIVIGYDIDNITATADNVLNIGNLLFGTGLDGTGTTLASGNIGIGTSSPASKLDVWGGFRVGTSSIPLLLADTAQNILTFNGPTQLTDQAFYASDYNMGTPLQQQLASVAYVSSRDFTNVPSGELTLVTSHDPGDTTSDVWGDGRFIYAPQGTNGLYAYSVSASGTLSVVDSDDQGGSYGSVWGDGRYVYAVDSTNDVVYTYGVSASGTLSYLSSYAGTADSYHIWGDGRFIYLTNEGGAVEVLRANENGQLSLLNTFGTNSEFVWGDGRFIYRGAWSDGVFVYEIDDDGNETQLDSVGSISVEEVWGDGNYLYVAAWDGGLRVYRVSNQGKLTFVDSDDQGDNAYGVWGDGRYVYLANLTGGLVVYSVDANGQLTFVDSDDPGNTIGQVWGDGRFVYASNAGGGLVVYRVGDAYQYDKGNLYHKFLSGNVGIGTSSPSYKFSVAGDAYITGALRGSNGSAGTSGMVLQSTGTSFQWVATSTLGLGGSGASTFLGLTDTPSSFTANRIPYTNSGATALTDSANFTFDGTNLGLGASNGIAFGGTRYLYASTTSDSIAFGELAGATFNSGTTYNVALGYAAGQYASTTNVDENVFIGRQAGQNNTANGNNIIGYLAGMSNTGLLSNLIGYQAGQNNTGQRVNAIGDLAGQNNTGTYSNLIGENAGVSNTGSYVNAIGSYAGANNTGTQNDFLGVSAGRYNTGSYNVFTGSYAGYYNAGSYNVISGYNAGGQLRATNTVAIGREVLSGQGETVFDQPFIALNNTAIGAYAGYYGTTSANNNILFGYKAGYNLGSGANNIVIGYDAYLPATSTSNALNIGNLIYGTGLNGGQQTLATGNIGIGTTTPVSKFAIQNTAFNGAGTVGMTQYLTTANSSNGAVQFGNNTRLTMTSNSATTTMVGNFLGITDGTAFGNTVRGLEVQADLGGNTQGENTALSGYARTFGVRGYTSADAGGTYEPAAGFFELGGGGTQGNAIRGYSANITTSELLSLFQDTSTFTGTGLLMNFGNSGGSFSSTSSKFIDLQNAGSSYFTISAYGTTTIGNGTTNRPAGLQIGYGGLCVDNDGSCNASTTGRISSVSSYTGNSDLAEMYFSSQNLKPGDIVMTDGFLSVKRASSNNGAQVLGVVSTKPGLLLGFDDSSLIPNQKGYPLALSGRVPVRLSDENGPIAIGDPLTLSSLPGIAMKAKDSSEIVGYALESFDGSRAYTDGFIDQFGDDISEPNYEAYNINPDPRIDDGCYYGGGTAMGREDEAKECDEAGALTAVERAAEEKRIAQAKYEAEQEALLALKRKSAEAVSLTGTSTVRVGQVIMFVDRGYHLKKDQLAILSELTSTSTELVLGAKAKSGETLWSRLKVIAQNFVDGVLTVTGIKSDKVTTKELCVDDVCVDAAKLRALLEASNNDGQVIQVEPAPSTGGGQTTPPPTNTGTSTPPTATTTPPTSDPGTGTTTPTTTPEPEPTPEAEPEVVEETEPEPAPEVVEEPEPTPEPESEPTTTPTTPTTTTP